MSSRAPRRGLEWYVARRYLSSKGGSRLFSLITWIALGGVTVGVSALVVVIGVMSGMQEDLLGKILESSPHVLVQQAGGSLRMDNWETVADRVRKVEGVVAVAPWLLSSVTVMRGDYSQSADYEDMKLPSWNPFSKDKSLPYILFLRHISKENHLTERLNYHHLHQAIWKG